MKKVTTYQAKTHLSALIREAEKGNAIVIMRGDVPVARLTAEKEDSKETRPAVGTITSEKIELSKDAFQPLSDNELTDWGLS